MLTADDLLAWFQRFDLPEQARSAIGHIRSAGPARRVGGGKSNVAGRYPSRKMGVSIQFESHRVELAGIYEMEHDARVLEYFDQPPAIKLVYESSAGKRMGVLHTPDFFVIREKEAGWEEWKTEVELQRLARRNSNRYSATEGGRWRCPPGVAHAERLGLYYRVRSSAEIDWVFQRNIQFLEDYFRCDSREVSPASRDVALASVAATPGLPLEDLLQVTKDKVTPDEIFSMIAADVLYVDWRAAALAEPTRVKVFLRPESATLINVDVSRKPDLVSPSKIQCGTQVSWDGRLWNVLNLGDTSVSLLSEDQQLTEIPVAAFETLVREDRLKVVSDDAGGRDLAIHDRLSRASEADLKAATYRSRFISQYLGRGSLPASAEVPRRTFFRWLCQFRKAEAAYGNGFWGLLPHLSERGNRAAKLPEASRRLMHEHIERDYETLKQKTKYASWTQLQLACDAQEIPPPSYKSFCLAVRRRPAFDQTLKRQGRRASYRVEAFYWNLELTTPRHGDRPFEIVHMDHTELDVECVTTSGQPLDRPWMTLLTDAYSRRTLAFYLTFDPPSYRSCMMVLRECVRRFGRLPQILVVDGGREFESTYFETLLARYECTKKTRPPAKARFGSVLERMFGVTNTQFIHNLRGNTQITLEVFRHLRVQIRQRPSNVRQVTKAVDPKGLATYEVHDTLNHQALGQSPRQAFHTGLARGGSRIHRMIAYNDEFLMLTLPTTPKGTARVMPSRGVKIHHIYYWCEAFRQIEGEVVPVRYDPFDAGIAHAFVRKQWLQCHSDCYGTLKGRSEREIMLATTELRRRHQNHSAGFHVTARRLAEFLQSVEAEETLLVQRLRDGESRALRLGIHPAVENSTVAAEQDVPLLSTAPAAFLLDEPVDELYGQF